MADGRVGASLLLQGLVSLLYLHHLLAFLIEESALAVDVSLRLGEQLTGLLNVIALLLELQLRQQLLLEATALS